jgi:predicted nucleotidyltransferase component of viral defense system
LDAIEIRKLAILALFSDDLLASLLVLKGGNALNLVYGVGARSSLDIDVSLAGDFEDEAQARDKIFEALAKKFKAADHTVIDLRFERKPREAAAGAMANWGGYEVKFKVIPTKLFRSLGGDAAKASRQADEIGPGHQRTFNIQISKGEHCTAMQEVAFADHAIPVYTPSMIAMEKLRAICQQMPAYEFRKNPTPRARDFYDIHTIVTEMAVDLAIAENLNLVRLVFAAKAVPLLLISRIGDSREFHRQEWPDVQDYLTGVIEPFDFYFDFVIGQTKRLEALWAV